MVATASLRPGLLAILLPVSYALLLPSASLHPLELLRQVRVRLSAALFHVKLLGVTDGGGLLTWPRVQLQLHRLLGLEVQRRLAVARGGAPPPMGPPLWRRLLGRPSAPPPPPMGPQLVFKDLVLVGGGHSHVHVLKMFGMRPEPGVRLTLVTRDVETPYSGMLPGYVAGFYTRRECHIDLARLAAFAGARLVHAEAVGLDWREKRVLLRGRPAVAYDVLSIDIGITPRGAHEVAAAGALPPITPVKPIDGFCARWDAIVARVRTAAAAATPPGTAGAPPVRIVVVGGGAGGVELALSIEARLARELRVIKRKAAGRGVDLQAVEAGFEGPGARNTGAVEVTVISRSAQLLPRHGARVRDAFAKILEERGVRLLLGEEATSAGDGEVRTASGAAVAADEVIWCTQAGTQAWLGETGLELDGGGFIAVQDTLESTNVPSVFAAGDVASVLEHPRPKAGVFAVRQGPPLADNLRRKLLAQPLVPFEPQHTFLGLIGTGDGGCVASRANLALEGCWLWELKDWIDRTWMASYGELLPNMAEMGMGGGAAAPPAVAAKAGAEALEVLSHASMRCGGCGAKVGGTTLSKVIARLSSEGHLPPPRSEVLVGLEAPDDCAVLAPHASPSVHTVDFFRSFIGDPFTFGRVAANHALSDCHAMGARPVGALAVAVVPYGLEEKVGEELFQMMSGACAVLKEARCALIGGHSCEGAELSLGFAITGAAPHRVMTKGGLAKGQALVLTKALGTGVLFAAHMRGAAPGHAVAAALRGMVQLNEAAAGCLDRHGAAACTDVTGFGLLGHLVEMAKASAAKCRVDLSEIPILPGALDCVAAGIFSSLQPANVRLKRAVANEAEALGHKAYPLLFDPQTAGGLLAAVPAAAAAACVAELRALGYADAAVIGEVVGPAEPDGGDLVECRVWSGL